MPFYIIPDAAGGVIVKNVSLTEIAALVNGNPSQVDPNATVALPITDGQQVTIGPKQIMFIEDVKNVVITSIPAHVTVDGK